MLRAPKRKKPAPYKPPLPPAASYDPALDAQRRAASRGLRDVTDDAGTAGLRDTVDYGLGRESILRDRTQGIEDLTRQRDRGVEDISQQLGQVQRGFTILGDRQRQQMQAAGVGGGGARLQAIAKREANLALARQPLDQARANLDADVNTQQGRLETDTASRLGRLALDSAPPDAGNPLGGRSFQDRATALSRAGREDVSFGLDVEAQKAFQATQSGWVPPPPPVAPRATLNPRSPLRRPRARRGRQPNMRQGSGRLY